MSNKHDYAYAKRHTRLTVLFLFSIAMIATGMVAGISDADARGGGGGAARAGGGGGGAARGGGGGGRKAQTSVSGANHAASRPSGGGGNRGNGNAGYANKGNVNTGNVNRGNVNTGNVNRGNINTGNINTGNVNIGNDVNIDIDGGYGYGHGGYYHNPIATGIAIGAVAATTAAVLGSSYYALPPGCTTVYRSGISYYYCGSVYYEKSWSGNDVVYVVVNP